MMVVVPDVSDTSYAIAGHIFQNYWQKITGEDVKVIKVRLGDSSLPSSNNIILIGSDAVNPVVHELIKDSVIDELGIRYQTDDYKILSLTHQGKNILILAGGLGRSTVYAIYDFFRRRGGVDYFWDGDVFHKKSYTISIQGLDVNEKPHFEYRGLRYFAHRGLHRFQAEHWDLDDWKKEIDWIIKSRMKLFMIRTGIDDLFQRTFPDVPYPPLNGQDPDAVLRSYNDRTSFWPLRYRGELRKEVLKYARERGLLSPEDVGTITHWYSPTPSSFYKNRPNFPVIKDQRSGYSLPTAAIWDIQNQISWDAYWKLTETSIKDYNANAYPRLFHTIGMAERTFGATHRENIQDKFFVYRKTISTVREKYPDVPILIAGWDLAGWEWKNQDVKRLLSEFDSKKTIILDYTDDLTGRKTYKDWGTYKHFPWIFGILNSLDKNSDIHGDYHILEARIKEASLDDKCLGLVLWPELSHYNTFLLQYIASNSWSPKTLNINLATEKYCSTRYPQGLDTVMNRVWESFLPLSEKENFGDKKGGLSSTIFSEPQFRILSSNTFTDFSKDNIEKLKEPFESQLTELADASKSLKDLVNLSEKCFKNEFWLRDALDIARTIASRALFESLSEAVITMNEQNDKILQHKKFKVLEISSKKILEQLANILSMSDDFSMNASMKRLHTAKPINGITPVVNSHTELTLKGNAENDYCRSEQFELVEYVYRKELDLYWKRINDLLAKEGKSLKFNSEELIKQHKNIIDTFYNIPLNEMKPNLERNAENLSKSFQSLSDEIEQIVHLSYNNSQDKK
jgi:hypothetical protein